MKMLYVYAAIIGTVLGNTLPFFGLSLKEWLILNTIKTILMISFLLLMVYISITKFEKIKDKEIFSILNILPSVLQGIILGFYYFPIFWGISQRIIGISLAMSRIIIISIIYGIPIGLVLCLTQRIVVFHYLRSFYQANSEFHPEKLNNKMILFFLSMFIISFIDEFIFYTHKHIININKYSDFFGLKKYFYIYLLLIMQGLIIGYLFHNRRWQSWILFNYVILQSFYRILISLSIPLLEGINIINISRLNITYFSLLVFERLLVLARIVTFDFHTYYYLLVIFIGGYIGYILKKKRLIRHSSLVN